MKDAFKNALCNVDGLSLALAVSAMAIAVSNICSHVVSSNKTLSITGPYNLSLEIK